MFSANTIVNTMSMTNTHDVSDMGTADHFNIHQSPSGHITDRSNVMVKVLKIFVNQNKYKMYLPRINIQRGPNCDCIPTS